MVLLLSCCSYFDQSQHMSDLVVMLILYSHQKGTQVVIKQSSGSSWAVIRRQNWKYWSFIVRSMGLKDFQVLLFYFRCLNSDGYMTVLQFTAHQSP